MTTADRYTDDWYKAYTVEADISRGLREQNRLLVGALRDLVDAAATVGRVDGGTEEDSKELDRASVRAVPAGYMALVEATDGTLRDVVRLHAPMWDLHQYVCRGCDADGYEWEPPQWPCSTVELIADQLGVELGE